MNSHGWRVKVSNEPQTKWNAIHSITNALDTQGIPSWGDWEISPKGPSKKEPVTFTKWRENLRLTEVFNEYGFSSSKQGSQIVYSVALYNQDSVRVRQRDLQGSLSPRDSIGLEIDDLESLPDLRDVIRGTEKAPISIGDDEQVETSHQESRREEKIKVELSEPPPTATVAFLATTATPPVATEISPTATETISAKTEASLVAGTGNDWSRQGSDNTRSLRLRPQASLRATARLRDRSQRRDEDRRSRSRGVGRRRT
jgi:hypothetical protein